jgi:ABC-type antimicrobial peptide transport system permease subunit
MTSSRVLFLRTSGHLEGVAAAVRREMQALDPDVPYVDVSPFSEVLGWQTRTWRMGATLLSLFAGLALLLAVAGIFSSVSYAVTSRTPELGVRLALGARFPHLLWTVVRSALGLALAGVAIGVALILWLGRYVDPLLFEVKAGDPGVLAVSAATLLAAAWLASLFPALRIRRIDPSVALRAE